MGSTYSAAFAGGAGLVYTLSKDKDIRLELKMLTAMPQPGEAVWIRVELQNLGNKPADIDVSYPLAGFQMSLRDSKSNSIPVTRFGAHHLERRDHDPSYGVILPPGEKYTKAFNLSLYYDLSEQQTYFLTLCHKAQEGKKEELCIRDYKFVVVDQEQGAVIGGKPRGK